jgi:urease accessory protein
MGMSMTTVTATSTVTLTDTSITMSEQALLRLFQLSSAALPIGAFAYSQGLEQAVALGDVRCRDTAAAWACGMLERSVFCLDVPVFARIQRALASGHAAGVRRWNDYLFASRGSAELRAEERQVGSALARLLSKEGVEAADVWVTDPRVTLATSFALASVAWSAPLEQAALSYTFAWAEAQVGAATRLIPLGQTDAQRVLSRLIARASAGIAAALERPDAELGSSTPGQLLLSALHETQYSRLFRS